MTGPPRHGGDVLGAEPLPGDRCRFVVWAPRAAEVDVRLLDGPGGDHRAEPAGHGYHAVEVEGCPPGTRYRYVLDGDRHLADPASRHQPDGVHGPSAVFDPGAHRWGDDGWRMAPLGDHVIYELHVGTFSSAGTFDGAVDALDHLVALGVTAVEPMPIAQFPGARNWGYDGVFPYAVQDSYGGPAAFQRFVDQCHRRGLAVVLDVVYNHLGPEGNVLDAFGPYLTDRYATPWGPALNFDQAGSDEVRRYFIDNALGWFADFHVDALRLDAVHGIVDPTAHPFLAELAEAAADLAARRRTPCLLIAESADNDPRVLAPAALGGLGLDAQWNDDYHHALHAAVTGERTGYYADYGPPGLLATATTDGFVHQGGYSAFRGRRHGAPAPGTDPARYVVFAQNHDHVGNRPRGDRLAATLPYDALRLVAALVLLAPGTPLLFMGEEYGEPAPFPYFVDHGDPDLVEAVRRGRASEFAAGWSEPPLDPADEATFRLAVLDRAVAAHGDHARLLGLYTDLVDFRRRHRRLLAVPAHELAAHADGPVLVVERRRGPGSVLGLYNLSGAPAPAADAGGAGGAGGWAPLVDSDEPAWGGDGQPAGPGLLAPYGFRLLVAAGEG